MYQKPLLICIGISILKLSIFAYDQNDINASREYHEKYLKGKITQEVKSDVARNIQLSDFQTYKEFDISTIVDSNDTGFKEIIDKTVTDEATDIKNWISSKAYENQFNEHINYILKDQSIGGYTMQEEKLEKEHSVKLNNKSSEHIYIVISSSMPINQIQEFFRQVEGKEHITFVLRGLVGKGIKHFEPTLKYMNKLLTKDPHSDPSEENRFNIDLHINPKVTQRYKITKVPALIYVQNHDGLLEDSIPTKESNEKYWISYGMGSIDYTIERINKKVNSKWLAKLLEKNTFFSPTTN